MFKSVLTAVVILWSSSVAASDIADAERALSAFAPKQIAINGETLIVLMDENVVTDFIAMSVVQAGLAPYVWLNEAQFNSFSKIILKNKFASQGVVFSFESDFGSWCKGESEKTHNENTYNLHRLMKPL